VSGKDIEAEKQLHPAVVRARDLRCRAGLPASLVNVTVLSRVNNLFENVGRSGTCQGV